MKVVGLLILVILMLVNIAAATENEYTFVNTLNREVNDLHIVYSQSIDTGDTGAPNPIITAPVQTDFSRDYKELTINFVQPLPIGGNVKVKAYTNSKNDLTINTYQWSIIEVVNNKPVDRLVDLPIKVEYRVVVAKDGEFSIGYKPIPPQQQIPFKNIENIKDRKIDIKTEQGSIIFFGKLDDISKVGKFTATIKYQNQIVELIVEILPKSKDVSTSTYTFTNRHDRNVNDLHIEYSQTIDKSSDPVITVANNKGNVRKGDTKGKILIIDFTKPIPKDGKVTVRVYSDKEGVRVENYRWSFDGELIGNNPIPIKYITIRSKDGAFTGEDIVGKPRSLVRTALVNKDPNVADFNEDISVKSSAQTKLTYTGNLVDKNKPGQFTILVDPPDMIYELVVNIIPEYTYTSIVTGGNSKSKIFLLIVTLLVITAIAVNRKR